MSAKAKVAARGSLAKQPAELFDLLFREVGAHFEAEHHTQSGHDACSRHIGAALQILQTGTRAPQNLQTAAEIHSLVAVEIDELETARIKAQCAVIM